MEGKKALVEATVRAFYAPALDVHWVTIKQLAQREPTLIETVARMIGDPLNEALQEAVNTTGVPESAARSILHGHTRVALTNGLRGDHRSPRPASSRWTMAAADLDLDAWRRTIDVNLTGTFLELKYSVRATLASGSGSIILAGSLPVSTAKGRTSPNAPHQRPASTASRDAFLSVAPAARPMRRASWCSSPAPTASSPPVRCSLSTTRGRGDEP